jgi:glucan phosphoethanolaminetransferase (alkaline phosphatase superfamily)
MKFRHLWLEETYLVLFRIVCLNRCWLFLLLIFSCGLSHISYFVYCYYINFKSNFIMLGVCATLSNIFYLCELYRLERHGRVCSSI